MRARPVAPSATQTAEPEELGPVQPAGRTTAAEEGAADADEDAVDDDEVAEVDVAEAAALETVEE